MKKVHRNALSNRFPTKYLLLHSSLFLNGLRIFILPCGATSIFIKLSKLIQLCKLHQKLEFYVTDLSPYMENIAV